MRKTSLLISLIFLCPIALFSQGLNNDFKYDQKDLNIIFGELGFTTFKFPIKQDTGQIYDFVIEEFRDGKLISSKSIIATTMEKFSQFGVDAMHYFQPKKDSVYMHRFYFIKRDTALTIKINTHGATAVENIKTLGKATYELRAQFEIKTEIDSLGFIQLDKPKDLLFLYANAPGDKGPLWCPSGLPRDVVIKKFYYVLFISARKYK